MSKHFRNNLGMTLIEIAIVGAIMSVGALAVMTMLTSMKKGFKRVEVNQSVDLIDSEIRTLLINRQACKNTFGAQGPLSQGIMEFQSIRDGANRERYNKVATLDNNSIRISSIQLQSLSPPPTPPGQGTFTAHITYSFLNPSIQPRTRNVRIFMTAELDATNVILNCWSDKSADYDGLYVNTNGPEEKTGDFTITGNLTVNGNISTTEFFQTSDQRLKYDIHPILQPLDSLSEINGVEFVWRETKKKDWGFIAQEIERKFPFLVHTDSQTGLKAVNYNGLTALTVEGVKQLAAENRNLEIELQDLKQLNSEIIKEVCSKKGAFKFCSQQGVKHD